MLFPVSVAGRVDEILRKSPCLRTAGMLLETWPNDLAIPVGAWLSLCRGEDINVQIVATSKAADALASDLHFADAVRAIEDMDRQLTARERLPASTPVSLQAAARQGIAPFRLAVIRIQRADYLLRLGRTEDALAQLISIGDQIATLNAPDSSMMKSVFAHQIVDELRAHGLAEEAIRLHRRFDAADRRTRAYEEIVDRIVPASSAARIGEAPRFIYDQYSDPPFHLFYGWSNGLGVGLQLEQHDLLADFVRSRMEQLRPYVAITDAGGVTVYGTRASGQDAVVVQFARTLPQLRVHVRAGALDRYVDDDQWTGPLLLIGVCLVLGLIAVVAQVRANRRQAELLDRQRAFTTRVTHELKTPLAGIRVMAENLESGAYKGDGQRAEMAGRILSEVDRLTERVDEVLSVARERTIPSPEPFDPEEVVLSLVDEWGPRFDAAGVDLHADLASTDPVDGDGRAMRDAIACLLDNALKYRRERDARPSVWVEVAQEGRSVVIAVTDNGIGVPRSMRKAIFDRFVRVEGTNRGKGGGHGLGLHQVREIVRAHHGTVTCTDGVDGGVRFEIRLKTGGR